MARQWWRIGLTKTQIENLEAKARIMVEQFGPRAKDVALERAKKLLDHRVAGWYSRIAGCISDVLGMEKKGPA